MVPVCISKSNKLFNNQTNISRPLKIPPYEITSFTLIEQKNTDTTRLVQKPKYHLRLLIRAIRGWSTSAHHLLVGKVTGKEKYY